MCLCRARSSDVNSSCRKKRKVNKLPVSCKRSITNPTACECNLGGENEHSIFTNKTW